MKLSFKITATIALVLVAIACSSSSDPSPANDYAGSCALLASRCHGVESPLGDECHDLGHDGDDSKCGPRKDECIAACPEKDGGHSQPAPDAGEPVDAGDASTDAPSDPCRTYCDCMKTACATTFADDDACMSTCGGFSESDLACFAGHCEAAKTAAEPVHDCEHASGDVACH